MNRIFIHCIKENTLAELPYETKIIQNRLLLPLMALWGLAFSFPTVSTEIQCSEWVSRLGIFRWFQWFRGRNTKRSGITKMTVRQLDFSLYLFYKSNFWLDIWLSCDSHSTWIDMNFGVNFSFIFFLYFYGRFWTELLS